jgi:hypothetical protein
MTHGDQDPGSRLRTRRPPGSARDLPPHIRWLMPRLLLSTLLLGVSTPVEAAVPLIRLVLGKRGVQSGPAIASLLTVATGLALAARVEEHPDSAVPGDLSFTAILVSGALLPTLASTLPHTVILRGRSPLWGWALWLGVRLTTAAVLAESVGRAKQRLEVADPRWPA